MVFDTDRLDAALDAAGADAYVVHAASDDSNQRYLSGFGAPDPFLTCYTPDGLSVLVSGLEYGRAKKEARADVVERLSEYEHQERVQEHGARAGQVKTFAAFLAERGVESLIVPERFPLATADGLREEGFDVDLDEESVVEDLRAVKSDEEVEHVRHAQIANERAMQAAEDLIAGTEVRKGVLYHEDEPLTSEHVKTEIEKTLLEEGCGLDETIVACGVDGADPHNRGSGPLEADEPIIIDIFPRDKESKYHADMTRTFVKGEASHEVREWFDLTEEALDAALDALEAGATGEEVHAAACEVYEEAGHATLRSDPSTETGFIHSTGHGIGLDVHEAPSVSPRGDELKPGHVVTIEPGLYDPDVGGVRIEDLVVVTEDGYENLTDYPVHLEI